MRKDKREGHGQSQGRGEMVYNPYSYVFGGGELVRLPPGGDVMCLNAYPSLN